MAAQKAKNPPVEEDAKSGARDGGTAAEAPKKKKGPPLKLVLIIVLALAVGGGGAVVAMKFLGGGGSPPPAAEEPSSAPSGDASAAAEGSAEGGGHAASATAGGEGGGGEGGETMEPVGPQNIEFKPFIVNLNDRGGSRFLKLTMSVEADVPALADEINRKMPQFRDLILLLLSSLSYDDIATLDGKMRLRNQMLNRINTQLSVGKIRNIYFSEFVVQ